MQYRHELKYEINQSDILILRQRLNAVMQRDTYAIGDRYTVRSLYFDTATDQVLREKIDGVCHREKYRIRMYNNDTSFIRLEKKCKENNLGYKQSTVLSVEQTQKIMHSDYGFLRESEQPLLRELYFRILCGLYPKTIVEYTREPFIFPVENVRVTLDTGIRTGLYSTDFLNRHTVLIPAADASAVLEVKWDNFLPDIVRDAVSLTSRPVTAFSKYAQCRIYG